MTQSFPTRMTLTPQAHMQMDWRWGLSPTDGRFQLFMEEQEQRFRSHLKTVARERCIGMFRRTDITASRRPHREAVFLTQDGEIVPVNCVEGPEGQSASQIIAFVAALHGVTPSDIKGKRRSKPIVAARYEAIRRVARAFPEWSYPRIGRSFERDHTSIMYALGKLETRKPNV